MNDSQNNSGKPRVVLCVELIKSFSSKELDHFESFISHPYFNSNKKLCVLLKKLRQYTLVNETFSNDIRLKIYQALFKEASNQKTLTDNQYKQLSELLNKLLALAETFLKVESVKDTDKYDTALLFPKLIDKNQLLLYSRRLKVKEKKLNKVKKRGIEYYTQSYQIQNEKARLSFIKNTLAKEDNYDKLQEYGDIIFLLEKLQYHLAKVTLERRYANKTFNHKPMLALKPFLNLPAYQSNPLIQLYQLNIQLVESEEESIFLALTKLLKEKQAMIPADFLSIFYVNLTNYCTHQLTKGDLNYYQYLFEIYNDMDEGKLLVTNKFIELALVKNMVTTACRINAFDWAVEKLAFYIKYIPKNIRESVFEYNSGIIAFNQQQYEIALSHFAKVRKFDETHELSLRIVQLQCYYETDTICETGTLQMIDSLKTYVYQNKRLTNTQKISYFNFIRNFKKLYNFKEVSDKRSQQISIEKKLPNLKKMLFQSNIIREKQWLANKIETLENKQ